MFERPSPAYYDDQVVAVVQNSSLFDGIDDMKGTTFGTMSGANAAPLLTSKFAEMGFSKEIVQVVEDDNSHVIFDTWTLLPYPTYQELSDALEEGTVDAMVLDGAIAKTYMNYKRSILPDFVVAEQSFGVVALASVAVMGVLLFNMQNAPTTPPRWSPRRGSSTRCWPTPPPRPTRTRRRSTPSTGPRRKASPSWPTTTPATRPPTPRCASTGSSSASITC